MSSLSAAYHIKEMVHRQVTGTMASIFPQASDNAGEAFAQPDTDQLTGLNSSSICLDGGKLASDRGAIGAIC